ncbi:MAG: intradiol ring-cleavage dioxygenase [Planctomycetes bacterium]|nr:intradiol ring-cleavage dioxygenase [Planctomycetota bacterium]
MAIELLRPTRRLFIRQGLIGAAAIGVSTGLWVPGAFAEELARTPRQTEGPFYPDHLPLDTDNDLLIVNNAITPAVGTITHLSGRVMSTSGEPVRNAVVEIWQVDGNGVYLHSRSPNGDKRDRNFQGYGRFTTGSSGEYYFRTVKPIAYPGRTAHIHVAVSRSSKRVLTTQCYIKGHPLNERDGVLRHVPEASRDMVVIDFAPIKDSKIEEVAAHFDLIIGNTPEEPGADRFR